MPPFSSQLSPAVSAITCAFDDLRCQIGNDQGSTEGPFVAGSVDRHPEYADTAAVDELRAREFSRLDEQGHVYLDYTGGGLYTDSQVWRHAELLRSGVLIGNRPQGLMSETSKARFSAFDADDVKAIYTYLQEAVVGR